MTNTTRACKRNGGSQQRNKNRSSKLWPARQPLPELKLDADGDTSITADTDEQIDFKLGSDVFRMTTTAFVPATDNAVDLGTSALRFRNIFTGDLNLRNDRGDWTLIEENDFISFRNNKTGRRYRMIMEDITGMGNYGPGNDGEM